MEFNKIDIQKKLRNGEVVDTSSITSSYSNSVSSGGSSTSSNSEYSNVAGRLNETHKIWGQDFNGTQDVYGNITGAENITATGTISGDCINSTTSITSTTGNIANVKSTDVNTSSIEASTGTITTITSTTGNISNVKSVDVNTSSIESNIGDITTLTSTTGNIDNVKSVDVSTSTIEATTGAITTLSGYSESFASAVIDVIQSTNIKTDYITVSKKAHFFEIDIDEIKSVGGQVILTPANATIDLVETVGTNYRCYFKAKDGEGKQVYNQFVSSEQVICQTFNVATGTSYTTSNKYYWRLVTGIGKDTKNINNISTECHYIDISISDCDTSSDIPEVGDKISQLGNRSDDTRKSAIIISAYVSPDNSVEAPSIVQYSGINNYSLSTHKLNQIAKNGNVFSGEFHVSSTGQTIEDYVADNAQKGDNGYTPYIQSGYWYINGTNTGVKAQGVDGNSVTISSTSVTYQSSTSGTTTPTGTWSTTIPSISNGSYLWTKTIVTYNNETSTTSYSVSRYGVDGANGNSITISNKSVTYAVTTNSVQPSDSSFVSSTIPTVSVGNYLWSKTTITFSDSNVITSYSVSRIGSDGSNGTNGVDSYLHIAYATNSNGSTGFSTTYFTGALYIGTCNNNTKSDPNDYSVYTWARLKGDTGIGISSTTITYQLGTSGTTKPTGTWTSDVPTLIKGQYLWTKTVWNYTDSTTGTGYSVSYIANDGNNGSNGIAGKDGVGIVSTTITYQIGDSGSTAPTSTWTSTIPTPIVGKYLWTKTVWNYSDSTTETGYSVSKYGEKGDTGISGNDGKGISSIVSYYLATSLSSGVTTATSGWTSTVQSITSTNKYLWNYEVIYYTIGNSTTTSPRIIGVWGNTGATGASGENAIEYHLVDNGSYATVDKDKLLHCNFDFSVIRIEGDTAELISDISTGEYSVYRSFGSDPNSWLEIQYSQGASKFTESFNISNKYTESYIKVKFEYNGDLVEYKTVIVRLLASASFDITDSITSRVTASETNINNLTGQVTSNTNNISTVTQKANSIESTVSSHTTSISNLSNTVSSQTTSISSLQQTSNGLVTDVSRISRCNVLEGAGSGDGWNGYTNYSSNYFFSLSANILLSSPIFVNNYDTYTLSFENYIGGISTSNLTINVYEYSSTEKDNSPTDSSHLKTTFKCSNMNLDSNTNRYWKSFTATTSSVSYFKIGFLSSVASTVVGWIQVESGTTHSDFNLAETINQSIIKQTADNIELKVKNTGIDVDNGTITLTADTTKFKNSGGSTVAVFSSDGYVNTNLIKTKDIQISGTISETHSYINKSDDITIVDFNTINSLSVSADVTNDPHIIVLPMYNSYSGGNLSTLQYRQSGTSISIQNSYSISMQNWQNAEDLLNGSGRTSLRCTLNKSALFVVTDPRVISYNNYTSSVPSIYANGQDNSNDTIAYRNGRMVCNGKSARIAMILPSQTLKLQSSIESYTDSNGNTGTYLVWYVVNASEYTSINKYLMIEGDSSNFGTTSTSGSNTFQSTNIYSNWAGGGTYGTDFLIAPKQLDSDLISGTSYYNQEPLITISTNEINVKPFINIIER